MTDPTDQDERLPAMLEVGGNADVPPAARERAHVHLATLRQLMADEEAEASAATIPTWVRPWGRTLRYAVPGTAACVIVVALGALLLGQRSSLAFADVLEQIRAFRPYSCRFTFQYDGREPFTKRVQRLSLSRRRETRPDGSTMVVDLSQQPVRTLTLFPKERHAVEAILAGTRATEDPDLLRMLGDSQDGRGQSLGQCEVNGRPVERFRVPDAVNDFTVWADPVTHLPLRVELRQESLGRTIVMDEFDFTGNLDPELFAVEAPPGYEVTREEYDGVNPSEHDLVQALHAAAHFLGGTFPMSLDFVGLQYELSARARQRKPHPTPEELSTLRGVVRRGLRYVDVLKGFHRVPELWYTGGGVQLGDSTAPVVWWRCRGGELCRVVYGDQRRREVPADPLRTATVASPSRQDLLAFSRPYACTEDVQPDDGAPAATRLYRWSLSRRREVRPDGSVLVVDLSQDPMRVLQLNPAERQAVQTAVHGRGPATDPDILAEVYELEDGAEEPLGQRTEAGRTARGFRARRGLSEYEVWIDLETWLPLRIQVHQIRAKRTLTWHEFDFRPGLDETLFSTEAPEGYAVETVERGKRQ